MLLLSIQRNRIHAWDMRGGKAVFNMKHDLHGLELPKNTVLEVELALELHGEVSYVIPVMVMHVIIDGFGKIMSYQFSLLVSTCMYVCMSTEVS